MLHSFKQKARGMQASVMHSLFPNLNVSFIDLFRRGLTRPQEVSTFIQSVRPFSTDKELIRLGSDTDGGYLLPNDLTHITACFSPGVSNLCDFDLDCANRGMNVYLADYSVENPPLQHKKFHFTKKHIGTINNEKFMTLDKWVETSLPNSNSDLMLQMDIEGSEYGALLSMSNTLLNRFRILIIEFHQLLSVWHNAFFPILTQTFEKILQNHTCVHIHPNNHGRPFTKNYTHLTVPPVMEFTFLRNDRIQTKKPTSQFPHPLDRPCRQDRKAPVLDLPTCWYTSN